MNLSPEDWEKYFALSDDGKFAIACKCAELLCELYDGLELIALDLEESHPDLIALLSQDIGKNSIRAKLDGLLDDIHQMNNPNQHS